MGYFDWPRDFGAPSRHDSDWRLKDYVREHERERHFGSYDDRRALEAVEDELRDRRRAEERREEEAAEEARAERRRREYRAEEEYAEMCRQQEEGERAEYYAQMAEESASDGDSSPQTKGETK